MNYTVLGFGARGGYYADLLAGIKGTRLVAVCEARADRLAKAGKRHKLAAECMFADDKAFFAAGRLASLCIVATQDADHIGHALAALEVGYDVLLEKPIAIRWEDCVAVYKRATELGRKVFVCHVLRYAPFFGLLKEELMTGAYGKPAVIDLTENVGYWHQAHSFVRGNWHTVQTAAPMIVAKCCHDLDIVSWLADGACKSVSSLGSLGFFVPQNAPEGAAERCLDCAAKAACAYDAERFYVREGIDKKKRAWPIDVLCEEPTHDKVVEALRTSPYGRCVFKCKNDVVDRQLVNMEFENGTIAHLTMTAFSAECYRKIHVHCERGEIYGDMREDVLYCNVFGKKSKKIKVRKFAQSLAGHGGGDLKLMQDIVLAYAGGGTSLTSIQNSMQSHAIGFAAEESRKMSGVVIPVPKLV